MIKITLKNTLDKHGISANKLAVESKVRPSTIYNIINNESSSVTYETLTAIIKTLRELTNDDNINVTDVFEYQDKGNQIKV